MKGASLISLWVSVVTVTGLRFQLPFLNKQAPQVFEGVHYSTISADEHPIDLSQYEGDKVVRIKYNDNEKLKSYIVGGKETGFKVWTKSFSGQFVDVQIDSVQLKKMGALFDGLDYEVIIDDLAQSVFESYPEEHRNQMRVQEGGNEDKVVQVQDNEGSKESNESKGDDFKFTSTEHVIASTKADIFSEVFFKDYRPLETIDAWLGIIQETFPDVVKIETIGETFEGRPYKVVHLSDHASDDHSSKKTVVITGGVHAREWISVSSVCYQLYSLLEMYSTQPDILTKLDFLFIPVSNPDGYEYSWSTDRLWRKNRQDTILPRCKGIDIDHSYDYHFTKSSDWPCGEEYSGEEPFEAAESKIWNEYLNKTNYNHQIYGYIDLHSYSEEILYPYAFSCNDEPRDEENLIELAYGISKAIRLESGKFYNVLPACQDKDSDLIPDLGAGTALDFMYHNKAFWAYQVKLRDTGNHGFLLPAKFIEPVGAEVFAGIKYFVNFITTED